MSQIGYDFINVSSLTESNYTSFTPSLENDTHLAIQESYEYDDNRGVVIPQYITYIDHPNIIIEDNDEDISTFNFNEGEQKELRKDDFDLIFLSQFYFGSLTVIGLFIIFRILQLKK